MNKVGSLLVVALVVILTLGAVFPGCTQEPSQGAQIGNPAPDFQLQGLEGQPVSLNDFRGNPVLLNFWASWCGPCRMEMPFLQELYESKQWSGKKLVILTVNLGDSPAKVAEFMQDNGLSLPVALDINQEVARRYNIRVIPMTFFVDAEGVIQNIVTGAFPNTSEIEKVLLDSIIKD